MVRGGAGCLQCQGVGWSGGIGGLCYGVCVEGMEEGLGESVECGACVGWMGGSVGGWMGA